MNVWILEFALMAICAKKPPVNGELPAQRKSNEDLNDFFTEQILNKQWVGWQIEMHAASLHSKLMVWSQTKNPKIFLQLIE